MGFEGFVGMRYLMAKRQRNVLSVITLISIGGVAVGVMALIVVLSVMGGFEGDLRQKILGTKSHIVVTASDGQIADYAPLLERVAQTPGVIGASPYVEGEVMINSPSNLQGVLLRGIVADEIIKVSSLPEDMVQGDLSYIHAPDVLMDQLKKKAEETFQKTPDEKRAHARALIQLLGDDHGRFIKESLSSLADAPPPLPPAPDLAPLPQPKPDLIAPSPAPPKNPDPEPDPEPDPIPAWPADSLPARPAAATLSPPGEAPATNPTANPNPTTNPNPTLNPPPNDPTNPPQIATNPSDNTKKKRTMKPIPTGPKPISTSDGMQSGKRVVPGLILGQELKKNLVVSLGDEVNIMSPMADMGPAGRMPKSRPFRTVGVFYTGMYEFDTKLVYVPLEDAQKFFNMPGRITGIEVKVEDPNKSEAVRDHLQASLSDWKQPLVVKDWRELNASLFSALLLEKIAMFIILTFIILVASFSIVCLLIMLVIEKGREIAVLKSMGATDGSIMRIFVLQGLVIGVFGTALGASGGLLLCKQIKDWQLQLPADVYYLSQIPVEVRPFEVAFICLSAVGISLLATVYPSVQAARLNPVDGLRFD